MVIPSVFLLLCFASFASASTCNHRNYGNGATVCVCSPALNCTTGDLAHVKVNPTRGIITSFTTTKTGERFHHREYHFEADRSPTDHFNVTTVQINRSVKYQKILGFGGAFTDTTGQNLAALPKSLQERLIRDYFGEDGLEYRLGRVPIGGTDFSPRAYSLDDYENDDDLSHFELQPEDLKYKIPFIHLATAISPNPLKLFGSPWSPPAWMKTNNALLHGGQLIDPPGGKYYTLFAKYIVRFIQEYNKASAPIWGLTVVNEPHMGFDPRFKSWIHNSLSLNATEERDFIKLSLGPELHAARLDNISLMILDDNIADIVVGSMIDYVKHILDDPETAKYVDGIAFHWYSNQKDGDDRREVLSKVAQLYPGKYLLSTEGCEQGFSRRSLGNWASFNRYADDIIKVLEQHSTGWVDWNLAIDTSGGPSYRADNEVNSPVIVNATSAEYYKQPTFYALGHFSKFLVPGSVRVQHQIQLNDDEVLVTVFERPDGSLVATLLNKNDHEVLVQLNDPERGFLSVELMANSLESLIWH